MVAPQNKKNLSQRYTNLKQTALEPSDNKLGGIPTKDTPYKIRRTNANFHQNIKNSGGVRNIQITKVSSIGGGAKNALNTNPTTDEQFNAEYAKQGLQPSNLNDEQVRKPMDQQAPLTVESEEGPASEVLEQPLKELIDVSDPPLPATTNTNTSGLLGKKSVSQADRKLNRLKARGLNKAIFSVGISVWLGFQVPFAILLAIVTIVSSAIDKLINSITTSNPSDGFFTVLGKQVAATAVTAVGGLLNFANNLIDSIFGIDLSGAVDDFFVILFSLMIAYGVIVLLTIYLVYKLAMLNPFFGEKSGFKIGTFILAIVGYTIPLLNLFPWFIPWTWVVGKYPK